MMNLKLKKYFTIYFTFSYHIGTQTITVQ